MGNGTKEAIGLVVSDLDGTLVDKKKQLTPGTIAAVGRLREAGIGFTIISARPRSGMMPIADALAIDDVMGAFNGGTIFRRDGTVVEQHRIDPAVVRGVFELVGDAAVDTWVFADDLWYASTDQGHHVDSERVSSNQAPVIVSDFTALYDRADKLTFVSDDPALLGALTGRAAAAFGARATVVQSQTYYLDVTALAANKGDGVALLAEAMGTPLARTAVIGDQGNDVAMFVRAGLSIAMGQGPAEVRAKADFTTGANDADGVAQAIDGIILPRV
ncbi:Cof-type HAD-IIB family hydrolase [Sphingomonas sp. QA11]|uniref:Cof-type HAD-IIB family hydrolase n=1 Tax=Sphingomonas sp. QA11 TaxID=2950605 RepID=UPI00234B49F4|nr:Cof-type HAD-IIB family hydrolase [Sphingomonas sp. QA11]WCM26855.1 Cof-type HAD-IIB family hydrolase [Sphingomonas sp. QA11]